MTAYYTSDETVLVDDTGASLRVVSGSLSVVNQLQPGKMVVGQVSLIDRATAKMNEGYVDPGVNSQLSFSSNSTDDTAAGLGARSVTVQYVDSAFGFMKQETLVLSASMPVNTVNTDMAHIESVFVQSAGANETNTGTITIFSQPNGIGPAVGVIQPGAGQTFFGHHFVPSGRRCWIRSLSVSVQGGVHPCATFLKVGTNDTAQAPKLVTGHIRCGTNAFSSQDFAAGIAVDGPARIFQWAKSDGPTRVHVTGSFAFYEENR